MKNCYLFEPSLTCNNVQDLEDGLYRLNEIYSQRTDEDSFLCYEKIWETNLGICFLYDIFSGVVNPELRRVCPRLIESFKKISQKVQSELALDNIYPVHCNGFLGFNFSGINITHVKQISSTTEFVAFTKACLKFGVTPDTASLQEKLSKLYPTFSFEDRAVREIFEVKENDDAKYRKVHDLLTDIPSNPFSGGLGQTEVLKYKDGVCSKRLDHSNRVTYRYSAEKTTIYACLGHYE
jgi:Txe/YoeB family toxin of Txe-Axe toxin-antitoxin module